MAIKYASIINSFVSTEGSNGFMTNYVYYTILVVNTDGSREIQEGKLHQIGYLLKYVRTPMDDLEELRETVKGLRQDINETIDEKMDYVINTLFAIPDITDKNEVEAVNSLYGAGLTPVFDIEYPADTPKYGIVRKYRRNDKDFKKVDLTILHRVPEIDGMPIATAMERLKNAGFTADVSRVVLSGVEDGIVLSCDRPDEKKLHVDLMVSSAVPETKGLPAAEAMRQLQRAGYSFEIVKKISRETPDSVLNWECVAERTIKLTVAMPRKYTARNVDIKWTNLPDSTGDSYKAAVVYDNEREELAVKLTCSVCTKAKHRVIGIYDGELPAEPVGGEWITLDPKSPEETIVFILPVKKTFETLPQMLNLNMQTQYGMLKKNGTVALDFTIEW